MLVYTRDATRPTTEDTLASTYPGSMDSGQPADQARASTGAVDADATADEGLKSARGARDGSEESASPTVSRRRVIRLVVVEDHALVREGTVELLEREDDLTVVGQAGSGEEALELLGRLRPDVALVDVELPNMSGIALAEAAAEVAPEVRVLIVSAYDDYAYVVGALEAGVSGYLLKTASAQELADAVRTVAGGALVVDEAISRHLTKHWRDGPDDPFVELTPRETDVLRLLTHGRSNKQIAAELGLGLRTVESHVSNVIAKFGVTSRTEAALYAVTHRVLPSEQSQTRV